MNVIDIIIVVLLVLAGVKGFMRGMIVELFAILAFIFGLYAAIEFTAPVSIKYFGNSDYFSIVSIGIFILIFLGLTLIINLLAKLLKKAVDFTFLGTFDNLLGAAIGVFKWALIMSVIIWIINSVGLKLSGEKIDESRIFPYIEEVGPRTFKFVSGLIPFFNDIFDSLEKIQDKEKWV
jgi:membrane protein required for colicin V production